MNKRRFIEKQNEIIRKSNKQKVLENRITKLERTMNESRDPCDFYHDDYADLWNESILKLRGRRLVESALDSARANSRLENQKVGRIGNSIVFNSDANDRLAQRNDKRSFELIKYNAKGLLEKECKEIVEHLNSLISYCDDAIDAVDKNLD